MTSYSVGIVLPLLFVVLYNHWTGVNWTDIALLVLLVTLLVLLY